MRSDRELVESAVAGDRNAAADLVGRHAAVVYAVCLGLLADPDRAQDAAQDALLKAVEQLGSLRDSTTFRGWVVSIARNHCRDYWKQTKRRQELLDQQMGLAVAAGTVPGMGTFTSTTPDDTGPDIQAALARLPEKFRLPLLLYYFNGLSSAHVGEALGISQTGAGARLCRARQALREILEVDHG